MPVEKLRERGVVPRPKVEAGLALLERFAQGLSDGPNVERLRRELPNALFDVFPDQLSDHLGLCPCQSGLLFSQRAPAAQAPFIPANHGPNMAASAG